MDIDYGAKVVCQEGRIAQPTDVDNGPEGVAGASLLKDLLRILHTDPNVGKVVSYVGH